MKEVTWKLTIDEANVILNALGDRPFIEVQELIQKIQTQTQAQNQLNGESKEITESKNKLNKVKR